jgi:hypothetical protein
MSSADSSLDKAWGQLKTLLTGPELCLDEIRACRPFFIGQLGERYGWGLVPTPSPPTSLKSSPG